MNAETATTPWWHERVLVPAGPARIGSEQPCEGPIRTVQLASFALDKYAVCNQRFAGFMLADGYRNPAYWTPEGWAWVQTLAERQPAFWNDVNFNGALQPVTGVSWYEAHAFAVWSHGRLPTECEWEKAARGPEGGRYPWGDADADESRAIFAPDFTPTQRAPGAVNLCANAASPYGAVQLAGNVFEWVADYFQVDTPRHRQGDNFREERPSGRRVLKGGAWTTGASRLRGAARWSYTPDLRDNILGFRLAYDV